jgi:hypothetical protein
MLVQTSAPRCKLQVIVLEVKRLRKPEIILLSVYVKGLKLERPIYYEVEARMQAPKFSKG